MATDTSIPITPSTRVATSGAIYIAPPRTKPNRGSRTNFVHAPAVADGDGHGLSRHAPRLWAPYVEAFLATIAFDTPPAR